jgi:hypothetical protein
LLRFPFAFCLAFFFFFLVCYPSFLICRKAIASAIENVKKNNEPVSELWMLACTAFGMSSCDCLSDFFKWSSSYFFLSFFFFFSKSLFQNLSYLHDIIFFLFCLL